MKVIRHGDIVIFKCEKCGCEFSEIARECYSSTGDDGAHYHMLCPDCGNSCWQIGTVMPDA